jgi:THO complex subunit 4
VDASRAPAIPQPKGLSERIAYVHYQSWPLHITNTSYSQPKSQPKSAATTKAGATTTNGAAARGKGARKPRGGARGGRNARPAKKTAEELDSEMADYFDNGAAANAETGASAGAAQPAAAGDAMDDEVLVS